MSEIKDFSKARKRIQFRVDDDLFEASPAVPAEVLMDFAMQFTGMDPEKLSVEKQLVIFTSVLDLVLLPESLTLFKARMRDRKQPIEIDQVEQILTWLLEEYGLRPTPLPSDSSAGQPGPESGTSSTENTAAEVSISAISPSTGS